MNSTTSKKILAVFDELPRKQRLLAHFVLENEETLVFSTANEIAERVGVSAATVVRFCRVLGYEGYPDLQDEIRSRFPLYRTVAHKMAESLVASRPAQELTLRVAEVNMRNVQETVAKLSPPVLDSVTEAIIRSENVYIIGGGLSSAAAVYAEHALTTLGFSTRAFINGGLGQTLGLSQLTDRDVVMVISIWRYLRSTREAAELARESEATCIALTDSLLSPIARLADHVLIAAMEGAAHSRSLTGILSLIDVISATVAARRPQESMSAIQRVDLLYRGKGLLISE